MSRLRTHAFIRNTLVFALLCFLPGIRTITISNFGVPSASAVGENVELSCQYQLEADEAESGVVVKWWWKPLGGEEDQSRQLYQRIGGNSPQAVRPNIHVNKNDSVILLETQPGDSGVYECEVALLTGGENRRHQTLVVYTKGTGPQLNTSLVDDGEDDDEEDDVLVECTAEQVAPRPELTITIEGLPAFTIPQYVSEPEDGFYDISTNVTVSMATANDKEIKCELFYTDDTVSHPAYEALLTYHVPGEEAPTEEPDLATEAIDTTEQSDATDAASSQIASPVTLFLAILTMFYKYMNQL